MPLPARPAMLTIALFLGFSAFAGEERSTSDITGSSGKYYTERGAACSAAQADARQTATSSCERDEGRIDGDLLFGACTCEQGGFEEKEWLCSAGASYTCVVETAEAPAAAPTSSLTTLELQLPKDLSNLQLLDRAFARRGFTLPTDDLGSRLALACETGWSLACKAPGWTDAGRPSLEKADKALETACEGGDDDACVAWGWSLEEGAIESGRSELFLTAARRYKALCDEKKNGTACYDYGTVLFNELGVKADPRLGLKRWEQACDLGEPAACSALAKVYRTGLKTRPDIEKAGFYANRACGDGDPAGCIEQALVLDDTVREQDQRARACTLGGVESCWELAASYFSGERQEPVAGRTRQLLEVGCDLGDARSCSKAGQLALNDNDFDVAASRFRTACAVNQVSACDGLVQMILTDRIDAKVTDEVYAFEVACSRADNAMACSELGLALLDSDQVLVQQPRARALLRQSCTQATSPARSCFVLGELYETGRGGERDRTLAAKYYKWACAQGWGQACDRRGDLLTDGVGVQRDHGEAVVMYQAGCDAGFPEACHKGGVLLDEGTYIPRDAERAKALYATSCERGVADGCLHHGVLSMDPTLGKNPTEARKSFETAVGLGNVEAHRRLAYLLWNGIGGKKDKGRAKKLTAAGCKADDPIACRGPAFQTE